VPVNGATENWPIRSYPRDVVRGRDEKSTPRGDEGIKRLLGL